MRNFASRRFLELVALAASRTNDAGIINCLDTPIEKAPPEELAHLVELDVAPHILFRLAGLVACGGASRPNKQRVARMLPALRAVAERLRDDAPARERLEMVAQAIGQPLFGPAPKRPLRVTLAQETGTDGGPVLALPKEALARWGGSYLVDGSHPLANSFEGTDYGRACAVAQGELQTAWGGYGFIAVGKLRGLVLGRRCEVGRLGDGSVLLVMEGEGEAVAALLAGKPKWRRLAGELVLPSGQLVLFDCAHAKGKTNNKSVLKLAKGSYVVESFDSGTLWLVRLAPRGRAKR
jgi:hypothetical protein